jgi:hypothetical protein
MRIHLFLVFVPRCSSWSLWLVAFVCCWLNIMEVIVDFEDVNRKICLWSLKKPKQESKWWRYETNEKIPAALLFYHTISMNNVHMYFKILFWPKFSPSIWGFIKKWYHLKLPFYMNPMMSIMCSLYTVLITEIGGLYAVCNVENVTELSSLGGSNKHERNFNHFASTSFLEIWTDSWSSFLEIWRDSWK